MSMKYVWVGCLASILCMSCMSCGVQEHADAKQWSLDEMNFEQEQEKELELEKTLTDCVASPQLSMKDVLELVPKPLSGSMVGTICGPDDAIWGAFESAQQPMVAWAKELESKASFRVEFYEELYEEKDASAGTRMLIPIHTAHGTHSFVLGQRHKKSGTELIHQFSFGKNIYVKVTGTPVKEPVTVHLDTLAHRFVANAPDCDALYQGAHVSLPLERLPARVEARLCNSRDSRYWAIDAGVGEVFKVSLEDHALQTHFHVYLLKKGDDGVSSPIVADEFIPPIMGLGAPKEFTFTSKRSGRFYLGVGLSAAHFALNISRM